MRIRTIQATDGAEPGYLRFPVRVPDGPSTAEALRRLGVGPSYPSTLAGLGPVQALLAGEQRVWPGAETLVRELITLPTHSLITEAERERVIRVVTGKHLHGTEPCPSGLGQKLAVVRGVS